MECDVPYSPSSHDPFADAEVAWHMGGPTASDSYAVDLEVHGPVHFGEIAPADEHAASIRRGCNGLAASLRGGFLSLDTHRARRLRPVSDCLGLYLRTWIGANGSGGLFFSDFAALTVHPSGLAIVFVGASTSSGKVYRELPLGLVERGKWIDLFLRVDDGNIDFICNGARICSIPLNHALCAPFDDDLHVGAWRCSKPDLYGTATPRPFGECKIDSVALWHRPVSDEEIAYLSGVQHVLDDTEPTELAQAFLDYNAFFDASVGRDVERCENLWRSLRTVAARDPGRPTYHLTQPLGHLFDPCGAFCHGGKYHVYSYRNIHSLLEYSSLDHYVSDDLVHWRQWPIAPWADSAHDVFCIYLMNHFVDDEGVPRALYTAQGTEGKFGVLARSDDGLISYTDKKAVLTRYHHDGHVWKEGDTWYTITSRMCKGTRPGNLGDAVMLWSSSDLEHWQERAEIFTQPKIEDGATEADRAGFMEFPYLLSFEDRDVLMLGGHPVRYWVGRFDRTELKFVPDQPEGALLDYANPFHCFNPLCVDQRGPGGTARRILMALYSRLAGGGENWLPWSGVHAMPRSLELDGDHLSQKPLPELQTLRSAHDSQRDIDVEPDHSGYIRTRGDSIEIVAEFAPGSDARCFGLRVYVADDGGGFVRIYFDSATNDFGVDAWTTDAAADAASMPCGHGPSYIPPGQPIRMQVFLDRGLLEAFANGQTCTTAAPELLRRCPGLDLFSEGGRVRCTRLDVWTLDPAVRT